MSYHVTILRSNQGQLNPIGREEVLALIGSKPALHVEAGEGGTLEITVRERGRESPLLIWEGGEVWTRNPDGATLQLMIELAAALGARVRGDELETYRTATESYVHPDDAAAIRLTRADVRKMGRRAQFRSFIPLLIFGAVVLLYGYCSRSGSR